MATVILVRHGRSTANASGTLAGRSPGVRLDATGRGQARRVGERIAGVQLAGVVSSPLKRCCQTAGAIADGQPAAPTVTVEHGINECDYGRWQGRALSELADEQLWSTVQGQPSAAVFPGGESLFDVQARAVEAIRRCDTQFEERHGANAVWAAVSHGDVIKAILADALGTHLDLFQRIIANPASVSVIRYTTIRPYVLAMNTDAGGLTWVGADAGAQVGGGDVPDSSATGKA